MIQFWDTLVAGIIAAVVKRAGLVVAGYVMAFVLSIALASSLLGVNTDSSQMLSSSLPFQIKTQALNRDFPSIKDTIVVVVRADIAETADATTRIIVEALKGSDKVTNVFAPSIDVFFQENGLLYQSVEELENNLTQLNKSASLLATLRADPTLRGFFRSLYTAEELAKSADFDLSFLDDFYVEATTSIEGRLAGRFSPLPWAKAANTNAVDDTRREQVQRLIYMRPVFDFKAIQPAKASIRALDAAIASLPDDLRQASTVGVTGDPVLRFEELKSVSKGIGLSLGLSFLLVAILLLLAFRSLPHVVLTFIALIVALVTTTGFAAVVFGELNLVSVAFIVLLVGLGLDFTIHALAYLRDEAHASTGETLIKMGRGIGGALLLSAMTTAIAFAAFAPTNFVGMAQLGVLGAVGVLVAFCVSITLVPALIVQFSWFAPRPLVHLRDEKRTIIATGMLILRKPLACCLLVLGVVAFFVAGGARFDADPIGLRDPESPSMKALALLQERAETVPYRLSLLRADEAAAADAAAKVAKLGTVKSSHILSDFVPQNQDEKFELIDFAIPTFDTIVSGEGLEHASLPEGTTPLQVLRDRLAQLENRPKAVRFAAKLDQLSRAEPQVQQAVEADIFRFFPSMIKTIEAQLNVDTITLDSLPDFFKERFVTQDGRWRVDVVPSEDLRDPKALERFVASVEAFDENAVGAPLQIAKAGGVVSKAMIVALMLAASGIFLITFLVLRSFTTVAAVFLPLMLAGFLTAAASVVFDIPFNYANVIVLPLLIGLGVDSGIHIAMRRDRLESSAALFDTSTPRAVLFSGLTTIAAFGTLSVSNHTGTASMGQMLAIAISVTLLCSIVLTPICMDLFDKFLRRR